MGSFAPGFSTLWFLNCMTPRSPVSRTRADARHGEPPGLRTSRDGQVFRRPGAWPPAHREECAGVVWRPTLPGGTMRSTLSELLGLDKSPVAISFVDRAPAGVPRAMPGEPASCGYWRRAGA